MQGLRWGSSRKIPRLPRAASGAGPAASARAEEQSPRPAQAHTDKQSEPHVQPGAAPPAKPHGHTIEGTCWGALCWQCAWSGLPTASDTTGGFPGLGLAPVSCGLLGDVLCWPGERTLSAGAGHGLAVLQPSCPKPQDPVRAPGGCSGIPLSPISFSLSSYCPASLVLPSLSQGLGPRWAADTRTLAALALAEVIQ